MVLTLHYPACIPALHTAANQNSEEQGLFGPLQVWFVVLIHPLLFLVPVKTHPTVWMAVAPASMADKIIVLDDEEETPEPHSSASNSNTKVSPLKARQPTSTHITQSPFASAKKHTHVLQAENQRLFTEVSS